MLARAALAASLALASPAFAQDVQTSSPKKLTCNKGPVERHFAEIQWHVLACDDGFSLIFVTGPKSPKDLSFYFMVFKKDGIYTVRGEGNGDSALTKPAYDGIKGMTPDEYRDLHSEASAVAG